jgi:hypothetical protein
MSREKMGASGELFETAGARLSVAQILLRTRARFAEAQEHAREAQPRTEVGEMRRAGQSAGLVPFLWPDKTRANDRRSAKVAGAPKRHKHYFPEK